MLLMLKLFAALFTCAFGFWAFFKPYSAAKLVGLKPRDKRGVSDIRSIYGGVNIGLGAFAAWIQSPEVFQMLGIAYLAAAICRAISLLMDNAFSSMGVRFLIVEIILGLFLML